MCYINRLIILLFCVTKCCAKIEINVTVASSRGGIKMVVKGTDDKIIGDKEVNIFNITESNLKRGIKLEFSVEPSDVYIKDPTTYGNVFQKYKWPQVTRKTLVKRISIQDIMYENVLLTVHDNINNTPRKIKVPIKVFENVENSIKTYWSEGGYPEDEVYYVTNIAFSSDKRKDERIKFENKWRNNTQKMVTLPVGYETSGHIDVGAGKTVTMKLRTKKTIILLKIIYETKLTGNLVANYPRRLGPYHFWAPSVSSIMKTLNLTNKIITSEIMEIKCHTDPVLDVFDKLSGKRIPIVFSSRKPVPKRKFKNKIGP